MKTLLNLILFTSLLTYGQIPETADSIYWSTKYCDTAETFEEHLTQWTWNGNSVDCVQPSEQFANAFYDEETGEVGLVLLDSYDCCCKVASTPGVIGAWIFFYGSPCQTYLDSIGFIYDDPEYINSISLDEIDLELKGIYIDIYGRKYILPPKGLSIMNNKKYFRL
tara:strand:+ start:72 stop:569 length:498 start_codon:yes stop_codon:yes gene_type:complete